MKRWKVITVGLLIAAILFLIGDGLNEVLDIHYKGATMCMACIGLE
jgi:hypothetical protein